MQALQNEVVLGSVGCIFFSKRPWGVECKVWSVEWKVSRVEWKVRTLDLEL